MVLVAYNNGIVTIIAHLVNKFFLANGHYNAGLKIIIFKEPERTISKEGRPAYQPHIDHDDAQSHFSSMSKNKTKTMTLIFSCFGCVNNKKYYEKS